MKLVREKSISVMTCSVEMVTNYTDLHETIARSESGRPPPDVVCLTSGRPEKHAEMMREFKSHGYACHSIKESGLAILSRVPVWRSTGIELTSGGEKAIVNEYHFPTTDSSQTPEDEGDSYRTLALVTSKLATSVTARRQQISKLEMLFGPSVVPGRGVIFAGDTTISKWLIDIPGDTIPLGLDLDQKPRWLDAWREMGTADNEVTRTTYGDRMDRMWYHGVECVGYSTIPLVDPSDINAVLAEFKIRD